MRIIAHIDMDAFYAAVEERYNPALRGKPLVVGADPKGGTGRGVVTTANYLARKYGIRSATPISRAWRLAEAARHRGEPETTFIRGNRRLYVEVSERIMATLARSTDRFEEASIDEAYLDLSSLGTFEAAATRARAVKAEIAAREGLTCSVGIGPNKLVAKIASDFRKPDGLTLVPPDAVQAFIDPLSIRVIPGIGPKTAHLLHERGVRVVHDLRSIALPDLVRWFGKWGDDLFAKARGISDSPVSNEWEPKSIGEQETFERDTLDVALIRERGGALARGVFERFRAQGFHSFRTVTVTVRFMNFRTVTRSHTGPEALSTEEALGAEAARLLEPFLDRRENPKSRLIRLIGVRVEKLGREVTAPAGPSNTQGSARGESHG
jgi:nucleotidyltransferase/DNA polymerase involved in DNA repair